MKLYRRPDTPKWQLLYKDHTGRWMRVSTKTTSKREAQAFAKRMAEQVIADSRPDPRLTLGEALENYQIDLVTRGKSSAGEVAALIRKTLGRLEPAKPHPKTSPQKLLERAKRTSRPPRRWHLDPRMPFEKLSALDLEQLKRERAKEGLSEATIGHELKTIRAATRLAEELGYVVPKIVRWRIPAGATKTRYLSREDYAAVLRELTPKSDAGRRLSFHRQEAGDLLVALTFLGGRWEEVARLRWQDVHADTVGLWGNKTQSARIVPLPLPVAEMLNRRRFERAQDATPQIIRESPFVFAGPNGKPRATGCRQITDAMDRAGLNHEETVRRHGRATIHSLRHTYASWLLAGGADLADVQGALGHTTLQMTRRYAHLSKGEALARLSVAMGRSLEALADVQHSGGAGHAKSD